MNALPIADEQIARRLYPGRAVHSPLADPAHVIDADVERFRRDGLIAVENVFSAAEVEAAKEAISALIRQEHGPGGVFVDIERDAKADLSPDQREPFVRKIMWFVKHDAHLRRMSEHPRLVAIVERLLGGKTTMVQDMALLKPPHVGREKPWHQDAAYFLLEPPELILGTWTALDEATAENGCMHVIPGSHLAGPRPHQHVRDCQLSDAEVEQEIARDVIVPLKPGGAMFFSSMLHHGTPPNRSPVRRRALQFHYARLDCRPIDAADHARYFHDGTRHAGCIT